MFKCRCKCPEENQQQNSTLKVCWSEKIVNHTTKTLGDKREHLFDGDWV